MHVCTVVATDGRTEEIDFKTWLRSLQTKTGNAAYVSVEEIIHFYQTYGFRPIIFIIIIIIILLIIVIAAGISILDVTFFLYFSLYLSFSPQPTRSRFKYA